MFSPVLRLLLALAVLGPLLTACAARKKSDAPPAATLPTWLGEVVMVDAERRFVLVDTGAGTRIPPDTLLQAYTGLQPSAKLSASADARPPFLVADIVAGAPRAGDRIVLDEARPPRAVPVASPAAR